jgi:hypothetical protein
LHPAKLSLPETTTEDGIKIDFNPFPENADSSIRSNREPFSNVTDSSDVQQEKLPSKTSDPTKLNLPKTTTEDGISIHRQEPKYR